MVGNGQAAWAVLEEKYYSNTKDTRRECHKTSHSYMMQSAEDPNDFLYIMDSYRDRT